MRDETNGYLGFSIFFLIILSIVVLGTFALYKDSKKENKSPTSEPTVNENVSDSIKIDKDKDLIYFENEEIVSEKLEISYKDVVININSDDAKKINNLLNNEKNELIKNIKKSDDAQDEDICDFEESDGIYETKIRDYAIFKSNKYVTIVINDSSYNCESSFGIIDGLASYTFDLKNGKLLDEEDLLKKYDLTNDNLIEKVREQLKTNQSITTNGNNLIKINTLINKYEESKGSNNES